MPNTNMVEELEPFRRYRYVNTTGNSIQYSMVNLPFNIGPAWVDALGNCWDAIPTSIPGTYQMGSYIGVYYGREGYLCMKLPQ